MSRPAPGYLRAKAKWEARHPWLGEQPPPPPFKPREVSPEEAAREQLRKERMAVEDAHLERVNDILAGKRLGDHICRIYSAEAWQAKRLADAQQILKEMDDDQQRVISEIANGQ